MPLLRAVFNGAFINRQLNFRSNNKVDNFEYGAELENEGNEQINQALLEIKNLLSAGCLTKNEAYNHILESLSGNSHLADQLYRLNELIDNYFINL